jgi:hypothetical protein
LRLWFNYFRLLRWLIQTHRRFRLDLFRGIWFLYIINLSELYHRPRCGLTHHERSSYQRSHNLFRLYSKLVRELTEGLLDLLNLFILLKCFIFFRFKHRNHIESNLDFLILSQSIFHNPRWGFWFTVIPVQLLEPITLFALIALCFHKNVLIFDHRHWIIKLSILSIIMIPLKWAITVVTLWRGTFLKIHEGGVVHHLL